MAWNCHAIEQMQLRRQHRVVGVGRPKFDFHTGSYAADGDIFPSHGDEAGAAATPVVAQHSAWGEVQDLCGNQPVRRVHPKILH